VQGLDVVHAMDIKCLQVMIGGSPYSRTTKHSGGFDRVAQGAALLRKHGYDPVEVFWQDEFAKEDTESYDLETILPAP